jgi:hypothetical protein
MTTWLAALLVASAPTYAPTPDDRFWAEIIANVGETPLAQLGSHRRAVRLVRAPVGLIVAAVVTLERTDTGVRVSVKESRDRRESGAMSRVVEVPLESWETLRPLADAGLWKQKAVVSARAKPSVHDGILWFVEGTRHGEYWGAVRHEPEDLAYVDLVSHILRLAGLADLVPR